MSLTKFPPLSLNDRVKLWKQIRIDELLADGKQLDGTIDSTNWCAAHRLADTQFDELCAEYTDQKTAISDVLDDAEIPTQYSTPMIDADKHELVYLRDLRKLCNNLRTSLITMKGTSEAAYAIQDFLRLQDRMDWQGYESYGDPFNGKEIKERLNE